MNDYNFQEIAYTRTSRKWHEATTRSPVSCPEGSQRLGNQRHLAASSFSARPVGRSRPSERATCLIISSKRWPYSDAKSTTDRSISGCEMSRRRYFVTSFLSRVKFIRFWITKIMRFLLCFRAVISVIFFQWIPLSCQRRIYFKTQLYNTLTSEYATYLNYLYYRDKLLINCF